MNTQSDQLFAEMARFNPNAPKRVIKELTFEARTDYIHADLVTEIGESSQKTYKYHIQHKSFLEWLELHNGLENVSHDVRAGQHVENVNRIGYAQWLQTELTSQDIYDYLTWKGTINMEMDLV